MMFHAERTCDCISPAKATSHGVFVFGRAWARKESEHDGNAQPVFLCVLRGVLCDLCGQDLLTAKDAKRLLGSPIIPLSAQTIPGDRTLHTFENVASRSR